MTKWEYKQISTLQTFNWEETLNKYGEEGWEIITMVYIEQKDEFVVLMKREITQELGKTEGGR